MQASKFIKHHSNPLIAFVAEQLYRNNVVAVCRGRSESGPRALGNRSILANPSDPNMKYKLNQKVKFRESFRPFAPTVLEEHFADMLHFNKPVMDISER